MKRISGIVGGLKTILKYGVYIMAIIKIGEFAIETLEGIDSSKDAKKAENE
jgi:hypothetical protein